MFKIRAPNQVSNILVDEINNLLHQTYFAALLRAVAIDCPHFEGVY